jgi:hypothetical protein
VIFKIAVTERKPAKTKLTNFNPREDVEEIQDEVDNPFGCLDDRCQREYC